jgi:neutral ceramidase
MIDLDNHPFTILRDLAPCRFAVKSAVFRQRASLLVALLGWCWLGLTPAEAEQAVGLHFRAGAATSNITPDLSGPPMTDGERSLSTHIHDELHARCLVLDDGKTRLALVVCDLQRMHHLTSREARRRIHEQIGIPPENVLISATHTHSAGGVPGPRFNFEPPLNPYQDFVVRRILDGVRRAANNLRPAEVAFGRVAAPEYSFNRRWLMKEVTTPKSPFGAADRAQSSPGFKRGNLIEQAGPIDSTLSFLAFREPGGRLISVFSSYNMHYVGRGIPGHISADYFGAYCEALRRLQSSEDLDRPFVAIMASGTSGDVTVTDNSKPPPPGAPWAYMHKVADDLAGRVNRALPGAAWQESAPLASRYQILELAWRNVEKEMRALKQRDASAPALSYQQSIAARNMPTLAILANPAPVPVQVLRIGDTVIAGSACEMFAETGLEYKRRSPFAQSFLVSINHGYMGYLPTPRHFELGGYETWPGINVLEPQASVKIMDALLAMTQELAVK